MTKKNIEFKINENGCFIVTSHKPTQSGRVQFFINGAKKLIHRHVYEECFGEINEGEVVKQTCGNANCINPEHLELGIRDAYGNKKSAKKIDFKINKDGCFIITSHKPMETGHTQFFYEGRKKPIHRHIYEECFGEIPEGHVVRHTCDNGQCINPEHLIIGTQRDNIQDMIDRDRNLFYKNIKLDEEKVREIKIRLKNGEKSKDIFKDYGVSVQTIDAIKRGKTWKHINI